MKTITYNGHKIEVSGLHPLGKEQIIYDGKIVSSKHSMFGATHVFRVNEDGEDVQYDVEIGTRWHGFAAWCTVRRKGEIIFSDR